MSLRFRRDLVFECLIFEGRRSKDGYGITSDGRRAHIAAWECVNGPVPEGLELDHLCRRRDCINVLCHLEAVSRQENELRKNWSYRARRKKCSRGHDLAIHAVVTPQGGRVCRACHRLFAEESNRAVR